LRAAVFIFLSFLAFFPFFDFFDFFAMIVLRSFRLSPEYHTTAAVECRSVRALRRGGSITL
jgi:hypothetical protein